MKAISLATLALAASVTTASAATQLIDNGGFETGDFTGWTTSAINTSGDVTVTSGAVAPISAFTTTGPSEGTYHALTGQSGPGAYAIIQSFTVPFNVTALSLSFDMFAASDVPMVDGGLDPNGTPTQNARVDILSSGAGAFDTGAGVVFSVLAPFTSSSFSAAAYSSFTQDLFGILTAGETYQLRFAEADNQLFLSMGVDNVSLMASVSEVPVPAAGLLMVGALGGLAGLRRRKDKA